MDLHAPREGEARREQTDRAGTEHEEPVAGGQRGGLDGAQRVAARLDQGAGRRVDAVRQGVQRGDGDGDPLGERARPAVPDAQLVTVLAHMAQSAQAPPAVAAAEHGVPGGAPPEPAAVDTLTHGADGAAPLMTDPDRIRGVAVAQIAHLAGVELDVGAADTHPLDVHDDLTGPGDGWFDVLDRATARPGDDESTQGRPPGGPA